MTIRKNYPYSGTLAHRTHRSLKNRRENVNIINLKKITMQKLRVRGWDEEAKLVRLNAEYRVPEHDHGLDGCQCSQYLPANENLHD